MTLQRQNVPINLSQGLDSKTDPKQVSGKLLTLENGVFTSPKKIRKRNGYTALSTSIIGGGSITAGVGAASYKSELAILDGLNLYSYAAGPAALSTSKGAIQPVAVSVQSVANSQGGVNGPDYAYHAGTGMACLTSYNASTGSQYSIIDTATGTVLVQQAAGNVNNRAIKVVTLGTFFVIVYSGSLGNVLQFAYINTATPATISIDHTISVNFDATKVYFDVAVVNGYAFVAYASTAGTHSIAVARLFVSGSTVALAATALARGAETISGCVTAFGDGSNNLWVVYYNGTAVKALVSDFPTDITLANPLVLLPTVVETVNTINCITGIAPGTTATLYYEVNNATTYNKRIRTNTMTLGGTAGTAANVIRSLGIYSKVFAYRGTNYLLAYYQSTLQSTYFLVNMATNLVVAKLAPLAGNGPPAGPMGCEVATTAAGVYVLPYEILSQEYGTAGGIESIFGINLATINFAPASIQLVEGANNLHVAGGGLSVYDGVSVSEHGFHLYPEQPVATPSTSGGSMADGTYQFVITYQATDNQGQVYRSAPSVALSAVVSGGGGSGSVSLAIPNLRVTQRFTAGVASPAVSVVVYRTSANGTIFYTDTIPGQVFSQVTQDVVTVVSTQNDNTLSVFPELYTTGGEVDNSGEPATLFMCTYKDRMILVPAETPAAWWYSKEPVPGFPFEFSNLFVQNERQTGGGFTAGAQMDDKLILFRARTLGYVVGNGPAANGSSNDFTPWQQVVSDTGCNNAASVVLTPDGLMYQSPKGIYLLDRSLKDHYIGADVEAYNSYTVTSAVLVPNTTQVRFTLSNGIALMYDYNNAIRGPDGFGQWSVFTAHSAVSATVFQGAYTYLQANGAAMQETAGVFTDAGAFVSLKVVTGWLSFAGLAGFQRVYSFELLGSYASAHTLNVQVSCDFDPTVVQSAAVTASSSAPYQYGMQFAKQKCESIKLTISDSNSGTPAESMDLSAMSFEVGAKRGLNRLPATRYL